MIPQQPPRPRDRRLLMAAAALGGVLIGLVVMRMFSGGGGDVAVGTPPHPTPVPTQTTTTLELPVLSAETAAALARARDPFGQIVTVADGAQAGQGSTATLGPVPAPAPAPAPAQATPATPRPPAPTTTVPPAPPPPAPAAPAVQPPPVVPTLPAAQVPPPPPTPNTVSGRVGPIALAGVPVNVCVDNGTRHCTLTAPARNVSLSVSATIDPAAVTLPTVVPAACSNGQGAALLVNTGSAGTVIYVSTTVTVNGSPSIVAFGLPAPTANQSIIVSACAAPGVGVTSAGAGVPPTTGGLVDGLLSSLLGLLGAPLAGGTAGSPPALLGPLA